VLDLASPWALLLTPLPLVIWWLLPPQREAVSALRGPLQMLVAATVWLLVVFGLARPEWVGEPIVRTEAARDIMLAIDLSGSMDYRDFPDGDGRNIGRFEAVQKVVDRFIANRESDRVGMIVFGTKAYLQIPFTRDLESARALVKLMEVGMAGPKTALGDAIGLAIRTFESSEVDDRLLILLTDGNDTGSAMTPVNAAEIAKLNDVEVYTIGIGDTEASGEDRVDFEALTEIAERTGGAFFNAEDASALTAIYQRIDETAVADVRTQSWRPRASLVHWPAGAAALLIILAYAALLIGARRRNVPA
jgi:Ca-activated chloride channel family protein